jgi:transposase-like protein
MISSVPAIGGSSRTAFTVPSISFFWPKLLFHSPTSKKLPLVPLVTRTLPRPAFVYSPTTYLGAEEPGDGRTGRRVIHRAIVVIAVEVNVGKIGRVRLMRVPNVSKTSLQGFVVDVVKPGSLIHTDGWQGYAKIADKGFRHRVTVTRTSSEPAHIPFPGVHRVASLLKRWCLGTLQGGYSREHLPYYLDEFTFRFNRRTSKVRGLLFYRLVSQAVRSPHVNTDALFQATGRGRRLPREANHHG